MSPERGGYDDEERDEGETAAAHEEVIREAEKHDKAAIDEAKPDEGVLDEQRRREQDILDELTRHDAPDDDQPQP
jgi:hypothetical protein